jgi:hypothetical protein
MKNPTQLKKLEELIQLIGQDRLNLSFKIDDTLKNLLSKSIHNYLDLPIEVQLVVRLSKAMSGKMLYSKKDNAGYVFQMSHGTQQIKKYEPEKYKNSNNTPLRIRSRKIMHMVMQDSMPDMKTKMVELFREYPYHLLKNVKINLRMKNFHFSRGVLPDDSLKIYKAANPEHPNPNTDELYLEKDYKPSRTIPFEYTTTDHEHFYAINLRSGETSNVLHFIWQDELHK